MNTGLMLESHLTDDSVVSERDAILEFHGHDVFAVHEIPAFRFDSNHGSLVVADLWSDTNPHQLHSPDQHCPSSKGRGRPHTKRPGGSHRD